MSLSKLLALLGPASVLLASLALAGPLDRRQAAISDDLETLGQLDPVRSAVDYASLYYAQNPATLTAIATGAADTDASFVPTATVTPGQNAGSPPDATQGAKYQVDHIVELQFLVGAFSVNARPTDAPTSVPTEAWTSASQAIFSSKKGGFPAQSAIASSLSNLNNLQAIPNRVNGFKQQVFTGRLKSQPNNPSGNTYPTYFGKALQKLLSDQRTAMFSVISGVGDALAAPDAGNNTVIKDYFTRYAETQYDAAVTFLDTWVGKSSSGGAQNSSQSSLPSGTSSPGSSQPSQSPASSDGPASGSPQPSQSSASSGGSASASSQPPSSTSSVVS